MAECFHSQLTRPLGLNAFHCSRCTPCAQSTNPLNIHSKTWKAKHLAGRTCTAYLSAHRLRVVHIALPISRHESVLTSRCISCETSGQRVHTSGLPAVFECAWHSHWVHSRHACSAVRACMHGIRSNLDECRLASVSHGTASQLQDRVPLTVLESNPPRRRLGAVLVGWGHFQDTDDNQWR